MSWGAYENFFLVFMEMDVKCVSCGENGAEILISGKLLCPRCSRQEILHRVRKNLGKAGVNLRGHRSFWLIQNSTLK